MTTKWKVVGYAGGYGFHYSITESYGKYYADAREGTFSGRRNLGYFWSLGEATEAVNEDIQEKFEANPSQFEVEAED